MLNITFGRYTLICLCIEAYKFLLKLLLLVLIVNFQLIYLKLDELHHQGEKFSFWIGLATAKCILHFSLKKFSSFDMCFTLEQNMTFLFNKKCLVIIRNFFNRPGLQIKIFSVNRNTCSARKIGLSRVDKVSNSNSRNLRIMTMLQGLDLRKVKAWH